MLRRETVRTGRTAEHNGAHDVFGKSPDAAKQGTQFGLEGLADKMPDCWSVLFHEGRQFDVHHQSQSFSTTHPDDLEKARQAGSLQVMPANKAETPSVADDNVKWGVLGQLGSSGQGVQPPPRPPREVDQMRMDGHETAGTIGPASKQSAPDNLRSSHGAAAAAVTTALQQKQLYASAQLSVPSHLRSPHGAVAVSTAESHLDKWLQTVKECRKNDKTADKRPLFHENSTTSISRSQNTVHTNEKSTPEGQDILQLSHSSREITDSFLTEQDFLRDHIEQSDPSQPSANPEYFLKNKLSVEKNLGSSVQTLNPTSESRFRLRSVDERAVGQVAGESRNIVNDMIDTLIHIQRSPAGTCGIFFVDYAQQSSFKGANTQGNCVPPRRYYIHAMKPEEPAAKSQQFEVGDEILEIDGQRVALLNIEELSDALRGSPGSLVAIRLFGKRKLWVHERHISAVRASYGGVGLVFCRPENVFQGPCQVSGFGPFGVHSGVKLGDWIFNIDGQDIGDKNMDEVTDLLRGEPGSNVLIKVYSKSIFQDSSCGIISSNLSTSTTVIHS